MGFLDYALIALVLAAAICAICFLTKRKGGCSGCAGCSMARECKKKLQIDVDCNRLHENNMKENRSRKQNNKPEAN